MSKKLEKVWITYLLQLLQLLDVSFASLVAIPMGITSSTIGLKISVITAGIEKSIIKKEKKKHDKIILPAKSKLNSIEVLISKALID